MFSFAVGYEWNIQSVDNQGQTYNSLAVDSIGRPHIAYFVSPYTLKYAFNNGTNWQIQTVAESCGIQVSMRLGQNESPKFTHKSITGKLLYSFHNEDTWEHTIIDQKTTCRDISLALDNIGNPAIYYISEIWAQNDTQRLNYAHYNGSIWDTQTIAFNVYGLAEYRNFSQTALEFDYINQAHINDGFLYSNLVNSSDYLTISYGYQAGQSWILNSIYWTGSIMTVFSVHKISLKLDRNNRPNTAFSYERDYPPMKYLYYNRQLESGNWQNIRLPDSFAKNPSLALDSLSRAHIAYISQNRLMYAIYNGTTWSFDTITSGNVSGDICLELDRNDNPHISFFSNGLKYAYGTPTGVEEEARCMMQEARIRIYPNPAKSYFAIRYPHAANCQELNIFNVSGKLVKQITIHPTHIRGNNPQEMRIPLKDISAGIYFIQLKQDRQPITERLVIIK